MNTNFPTKKTFIQDFLNKNGNNLFSITYDQATIGEYYEFIGKDKVSQAMELYKILESQIKYSLKEKILKKIFKNYKTKTELGINYDEVLGSIFANRFRVYQSIFTKVKSRMKQKSGGAGSIDSVGLSAICKEYNISPTDLMKNYTLEQYFWFLDGIEWNNNATHKEGQAINLEAIKDTGAIKNRAEETRKAFENLKLNK